MLTQRQSACVHKLKIRKLESKRLRICNCYCETICYQTHSLLPFSFNTFFMLFSCSVISQSVEFIKNKLVHFP